MGISFYEFRGAMETFGAQQIHDQVGSRYRVFVPCYKVKDTYFLHSGSYYIVQRGHIASQNIMNQAMSEFGEKEPGGDNFWYNEIHSVRGILTLAALLDEKYSQKFIYQITDETYKKLLNNYLINSNNSFSSRNPFHSPNLKKLYDLIKEYDNLVNPFGNPNLILKTPVEYLDKIDISISSSEENSSDQYVILSLTVENVDTVFRNDSSGWAYNANFANAPEGYTFINHYLKREQNGKNTDEIIALESTNHNGFEKRPDDIDFKISIKTGLTWESFHSEKAVLATDDQIQTMITYLTKYIEIIKKSIIDNMIYKF